MKTDDAIPRVSLTQPCLLVLLAALLAPIIGHAQEFSALYVFGDSLSDTGNLAAFQGEDFPPPFFENRVSNGPVAVEVLAKMLELRADPSFHAVSGARAGGMDAIDLGSQIQAFLSDLGRAPADALYVVIVGGNDLRDARDKDRQSARRIIDDAVAGIDSGVHGLVKAGAMAIMVSNVSDIGQIPETRLIVEDLGHRVLARLFRLQATLKTKRFNTILGARLRGIEEERSIDIVYFDSFRLFRTILRNSEALGFTNTRAGCFSQLTFEFNPECDFGANFAEFLFFDEFHPTARTHERAGRAFFALVPESQVPKNAQP